MVCLTRQRLLYVLAATCLGRKLVYGAAHVLLHRVEDVLRLLASPNRTYKENHSHNLRDDLHLLRFNSSFATCFPDACATYDGIPQIPYLKNFSQTEPLAWSNSLNSYFGVANEAYFSNRSSSFSACTSSKTSETRHRHGLVLAMADGYDCNRISLFVKSLRDSGSLARVILFRSDAANFPCREIIESCTNVEFEGIEGYPTVKLEVRRYILALKFLAQKWESTQACSPVIIMDFKDAFFQRDPFYNFGKVLADIIVTEEAYDGTKRKRLTLFNEPSGAGRLWMPECGRQIIGRDFLREVGDMPILNSGLLLGTKIGMLRALYVFAYAAEKMNLQVNAAAGQGLLNFIYYTGMTNAAKIIVKVLPPAASNFVHAVYYHPAKRNMSAKYHFQTNPLVNALGDPYAIVHMFDRWHILAVVEEWMEEYSRINWKGRSVGPALLCNVTTS